MTQGLQIFHAIPDFFVCMCLDFHQTFVFPHLSSRTQLLPQLSSSFKIQDLNSYLSMFPKETVLIVIILYLALFVPFSQLWTHWGQGLCTFKFVVDLFSWGNFKKKNTNYLCYTKGASNVLPWLYFQLGKRAHHRERNTASLLK